jgi:hypothetical protein
LCKISFLTLLLSDEDSINIDGRSESSEEDVFDETDGENEDDGDSKQQVKEKANGMESESDEDEEMDYSD